MFILFLLELFLYHLIYECYRFLNICCCYGEDSTPKLLGARFVILQQQMAVLCQRLRHKGGFGVYSNRNPTTTAWDFNSRSFPFTSYCIQVNLTVFSDNFHSPLSYCKQHEPSPVILSRAIKTSRVERLQRELLPAVPGEVGTVSDDK